MVRRTLVRGTPEGVGMWKRRSAFHVSMPTGDLRAIASMWDWDLIIKCFASKTKKRGITISTLPALVGGIAFQLQKQCS